MATWSLDGMFNISGLTFEQRSWRNRTSSAGNGKTHARERGLVIRDMVKDFTWLKRSAGSESG